MALINITPVMTSNTTPAPYVVSASSLYTSIQPYFIFTNTDSYESRWSPTGNTTTGWIKIDMGSISKIKAFSLRSRVRTGLSASEYPFVGTTDMAKDFKLYGSNDDATYDLLYIATNETLWTAGETRLYNLSTEVNYRYYKLLISANNGYTGTLAIKEWHLFEDDGIIPTENSKTVSRRYTLPYGSKLRLDNLTSDLTYMLATESDGDNEGTLRIVDHAGKFILPKAGQKMDLIFDGNAGTVGNFLLSENITKYSSIRIVADLYGATSSRNSQAQDRTVSDILGNTGNDIVFSSSPDSSIYRYITVNFINENSFNVAEIRKANGNPCIEKIYGIY